MSLMDISDVVLRLPGRPPTDTQQDFDGVSRQVPVDALGGGLADALTVCVVVPMRVRTRRAPAESLAGSLANRVAKTSQLHCAAMRRLVLLFLMLILPLQWSWAAVASVCRHETGSAAQHLGHHAHEHAVVLDDAMAETTADTTADSTADTTADTGGVKAWFDADCASYHGLSLAGLISVPAAHPVCNGSVRLGYSAHSRPDHVPDQPLRPPLPRPV